MWIQKMQQTKGHDPLIVKWFSLSSPCASLQTNIIPLSVPCVPVNLRGVVECATNTLQVSWDAAAGAESYISTLNGDGGFSSSCSTSDQSCSFPHLQCAQTYMFSVVAVNDRCNSSESAVMSARTGKCIFLVTKSLLFWANHMKAISL